MITLEKERAPNCLPNFSLLAVLTLILPVLYCKQQKLDGSKTRYESTERSECCFYTRSLMSAISCSSDSTQWRILWIVRTAQHCSASEWYKKKCNSRNTFSESFHPSFREMTFDLTNCCLYFNSVASLFIPSRWISFIIPSLLVKCRSF